MTTTSQTAETSLALIAPRYPKREDCFFYHSLDLPLEQTTGIWDLRAQPSAYLGDVAFKDLSVLEIGPASGFLSFWMEGEGARVTALEPSMAHLWDIVPFDGFDTPTWRTKFSASIEQVRNSFWYAHQALGSNVRMIEADPYAIPELAGQFDVGVLGSVLLHSRKPFDLIQSVAKRVGKTMVITELYNPSLGPEAVCLFQPHRGVEQVDTWWQFSPQFFVSALGLLGFAKAKVIFHTQEQPGEKRSVSMFTVVCERA